MTINWWEQHQESSGSSYVSIVARHGVSHGWSPEKVETQPQQHI